MNKFSKQFALVILISAMITGSPASRSPSLAHTNQAGPALLNSSVIVRANRLKRYWKAPDMDDYWSWMPEMSFTVTGPINTGSAFFIDFTNEAGAPWYTVECETPAIDGTRWQTIVTPPITTHIDKRTTLGTG